MLKEGAYVMARIRSILTVAILLVVFVSLGNAQQSPATDSVADAAREQKALNSSQKKPAQKKVYTNSDVSSSEATPSKGDTQASHVGPGMVKSSEDPNSGGQRSSIVDHIFDRSKQDLPETIVVPGGTKITVDISEDNPPRNLPLLLHSAKVVNIVQVGSTMIPALSKVTIQESVGVMQLTDVTIDGVRYDLQTDRVPLFAGSVSEATFTLIKPVSVKR
jgi:hypothetical protein